MIDFFVFVYQVVIRVIVVVDDNIRDVLRV